MFQTVKGTPKTVEGMFKTVKGELQTVEGMAETLQGTVETVKSAYGNSNKHPTTCIQTK